MAQTTHPRMCELSLPSGAVLGIDVGKTSLHLHLAKEPGQERAERHQVVNDLHGFGVLRRWLESQDVGEVDAIMEATGPYWKQVAQFLHEHGYTVRVVNPTSLSHFARSELRRQKTDPIDARQIAEYACCRPTRPWLPLPKAVDELRQRTRHAAALERQLRDTRNLLESAETMHGDKQIVRSLRRMISSYEKEISRVETLIAATVESCPRL